MTACARFLQCSRKCILSSNWVAGDIGGMPPISLIVADWEVGIGLARAWTISAQIESRGLHPSYCYEDLSNLIFSRYET